MTTSSTAATSNPASALFASLNGTSSTNSTSSASSASSQKNTFLTLLTTQLQNQDPLNPLDNSQMTSQLAQISTVDGITQLNATLQTLLSNNTQSQTLQAAALVGHGVLVPGSAMTLSGGSAIAGFDLASAADVVKVSIKDSSGTVVRTLQMRNQDAGVQAFAWDGKTDSGAAAADGAYTFAVTAAQGSNTVTATALATGTVSAVVNGSTGMSVDVGALGSFSTTDVKLIM
ncbi:MAG: flagellar hook capping FlgD N-terminal domain-containing protein [Rhodocyclaceae bacterium]|nr:flagellar hook capping FlgD N-terminal domain-containing protein [Rhodocyclaceae bacterium]